MTVANQTTRTSAVGTATAGQEIAYLFPAKATSDLIVKTRVTATGVEATLTETIDYTATVSDTGGTVTLVASLAATSECHIYRDTPNTQSLDLVAGGSFSAENVEDALDKNARVGADNADAISRCIQLPLTDAALTVELGSSVDRASNYLTFDASGNVTVVASVAPTTATITAAAALVLAEATNLAMAQQLDLEPGVDVQVYDAGLADVAGLAVTNGNFIVGDGTNWVAESGATALTSLGAATDAEVAKIDGSVAYTGTGVGFRDEDDMLTNDATAPPSQQSVRAFMLSVVGRDGSPVMRNDEFVTYTA